MIAVLVLQIATAIAVLLVCGGLRKLVRIQTQILLLILDATEDPAVEPMAVLPGLDELAAVKCRVHGCGWPAEEDGLCAPHWHEQHHANGDTRG